MSAQSPQTPRTPSPPTEVRQRHLSRDDRIKIQTLRRYAGWTYQRIADTLGFTRRQIQTACTSPVTPRKGARRGYRTLGAQEQRQLIDWFLSDEAFRHIAWQDLPFLVPQPLCKYGAYALSSVLQDMGYKRTTRPYKIHLTDAQKRARIQFARNQLNLRPDPRDWEGVIFSDETQATNDPMSKQWITIYDIEDRDTWALLRRKPTGWMFASMFAGKQKGPGHFWEKEQGGITGEKYRRLFLPLVYQFYHETDSPPATIFMHDNALAHAASDTTAALDSMRILLMKWPAKSPDLNPIENIQADMKHYLEVQFDLQKLNQQQLRAAIFEAWEAVDPAEL